jgi:hypothetical protein
MLFFAFALIVVVNDFDFMGSILLPVKTDSILLVDPDAVLPCPASGHRLQLISRRLFQVVEVNCHRNHVQLAKRHACDAIPAAIFAGLRQLCGITIFETYDHILIIYREASNAAQLREIMADFDLELRREQ